VASSSPQPRLVLVGASSLVGIEVKARLENSKQLFREVVLAEVDATDVEGARLLGEFGGEAVLIQEAAELDFLAFDLAVLLGPARQMAPLLERAAQARVCIDASGASRRRDGVSWRLSGIETEPAGAVVATPQPVAATLARLLDPLCAAGLLRDAAATALHPAASLGAPAVEELHQQAVGVLNFHELPEEHLHGRLAFNVLPWDHAVHSGAPAEDLVWEVGQLLGKTPAPCAVHLLIVPAFYGYAFSVRLTLESDLPASELLQHLKGEHVEIATDSVSLSEAMNSSSVMVSASTAGSPRSFWLWAVADSLGAVAAANIVDQIEHAAAQVPVLRSAS